MPDMTDLKRDEVDLVEDEVVAGVDMEGEMVVGGLDILPVVAGVGVGTEGGRGVGAEVEEEEREAGMEEEIEAGTGGETEAEMEEEKEAEIGMEGEIRIGGGTGVIPVMLTEIKVVIETGGGATVLIDLMTHEIKPRTTGRRKLIVRHLLVTHYTLRSN